jgi:hypothetical protein
MWVLESLVLPSSDPKLHRHPALGLGGQDEQQLLQIGTMVFGVPVGDRRCRSAPDRVSAGAAVLPAEAHRSRVIMQLGQAHGELLPHREHHLSEQRCAIGVKQPIERTSDAVIAKVAHLRSRQPKELRSKAHRGLLLAVDGFALNDDRAQQHPQGLRVRHGAAPIARGHVFVE